MEPNNNKSIMCESFLAPADGGDKTKDYVSNRMKIERVRFPPFCSFGLPIEQEEEYQTTAAIGDAATCRCVSYVVQQLHPRPDTRVGKKTREQTHLPMPKILL